MGSLPPLPATQSLVVPMCLYVHTHTHTHRPCHDTCRILVRRPGIEPEFHAVEAQNSNHWTTREVLYFLVTILFEVKFTYHKTYHFKMTNSVVFSTFMQRLATIVTNFRTFLLPPKKPCTCQQIPISPFPSPWQTVILTTDLKVKHSIFTIKYYCAICGASVDDIHQAKKEPFYSQFVECLILLNVGFCQIFYASVEIIICFVLYPVNMAYYIDCHINMSMFLTHSMLLC